MEIISHRGLWGNDLEKNTEISFRDSFLLGFGTETDLRDFAGSIVISHDMPLEKKILFSDFLEVYKESKCKGRLALNIKSDGLHDSILKLVEEYAISNYFVFDMSIPDTLTAIKSGLNVFARFSEYESRSPLWDECVGIWYDSFNSDKLDLSLIIDLIDEGKDVCLVSSELHKRDSEIQWKSIKQLPKKYLSSNSLILCTDNPQKAAEYFYE